VGRKKIMGDFLSVDLLRTEMILEEGVAGGGGGGGGGGGREGR
jgi:hypothetical protein